MQITEVTDPGLRSAARGAEQADLLQAMFGRNGEEVTPLGLLDHYARTRTENALTLQIGGKATIGRGQVRCVFQEVE